MIVEQLTVLGIPIGRRILKPGEDIPLKTGVDTIYEKFEITEALTVIDDEHIRHKPSRYGDLTEYSKTEINKIKLHSNGCLFRTIYKYKPNKVKKRI
jgi:hypothetical protein